MPAIADKDIKTIKIDAGQTASWAQEVTLKSLLGQDIASNEYLSLLANKFAPKQFEELQKEFKKNKKREDEGKKRFKDLLADNDRNSFNTDRVMSNTIKGLRGAIQDVGDVGIIGILAKHSNTAAKNLSRMGEVTEGLSGGLLKLSSTVFGVLGIIFETYDIVQGLNVEYLKLYENGINFNDGLAGMTRAAGDFGISLTDLQSSFIQFSGDIAFLGTERIMKIGKQFKDLNMASGDLGLTNKDATDELLNYIDMLRTTNSLTGKTNDQLVSGAKEYIQELNQLSYITGKNRKESEKEAKDRAKNLDLNLAISNLAPEIQENIRKLMPELNAFGESAGDMADIVTGMFAGTGMASLPKDLQQIMNNIRGLPNEFEQLTDDLKSGDAQRVRATEGNIAKTLNSPQAKEYIATLQYMARQQGVGGDAARKLIKIQQDGANIIKRQNDIDEEYIKVKDNSINSSKSKDQLRAEIAKKYDDDAANRAAEQARIQAKLDDASNNLRSAFDTFLVKSLDPALPALEKLADNAIIVATTFSKMLDDLDHPIESITEGFTNLAKLLGVYSFFNKDYGKRRSDTGITQSPSNMLLESILSVAVISVVVKKVWSILNAMTFGVGSKLAGATAEVAGKAAIGLGGLGWRGIKGAGGILNQAVGPKLLGGVKGPGLVGNIKEALGFGTKIAKKGAGTLAEEAIQKSAGITKGLNGLSSDKVGILNRLSKGIASFGSSEVTKGIANILLMGVGFVAILYGVAKVSEEFSSVHIEDMGKVGLALGTIGTVMALAIPILAKSKMALIDAGIGLGAFGVGLAPVALSIGGVVASFGYLADSISKIVDSISRLETSSISATTDQIERLNKIPSDNMLQSAKGITAIKDALSDFQPGLAKGISEFFGALLSKDPVTQLQKLSDLGPNLELTVHGLNFIASAYANAINALNETKIGDNVNKTINDLSNMLFIDNKAGFWSGKISAASKVQELADSIGSLALTVNELQDAQYGGSAGGAKLLSPNDLQKRTIGFYDDQQQSNASLIRLLQLVNDKLDILNGTTKDGHSKIAGAVEKSSGSLY